MARRLPTVLSALLLCTLAGTAAPAAGAAGTPPPLLDIQAERTRLWGTYEQGQRALVQRHIREGNIRYDASGNVITEGQGYQRALADNEKLFGNMMDEARGLEARRQQELQRIHRDAASLRGGEYTPPKNTGTGPEDPWNRGVFGDQDGTFRNEKDFRAFMEAARRRGYKPQLPLGQNGGYIKGLDANLWDRPSAALPGSPAEHLNRGLHAGNHEAALAKDPLGVVADNIKKLEHDLPRDPRTLKGLQRQEWVTNTSKGAERILGERIKVARADPPGPERNRRLGELEAEWRRLKDIRHMRVPPEGRLYPLGAGDAEKARGFQAHGDGVRRTASEGLRAGQDAARRQFGDLGRQIQDARQGAATARAAGNTTRAAELEATAAQLTRQHNALAEHHLRTFEHLGHPEDGRLLYEVQHNTRLTPVTKPNGQRVYVDAAGRELTSAQVREPATALRHENVERIVQHPEPRQGAATVERGPAPAVRPSLQRAAAALAVLGIVGAAMEGARQGVEAADRAGDRSWAGATARGLGYALLELTMVPGANRLLDDEMRQLAEQIQQDAREGRDPRLRYWRIAGAAGSTLGELSGLSGIGRGIQEGGLAARDAVQRNTTARAEAGPRGTLRGPEVLAEIRGDLERLRALAARAPQQAAAVAAALDKAWPLENAATAATKGLPPLAQIEAWCREASALRDEIAEKTAGGRQTAERVRAVFAAAEQDVVGCRGGMKAAARVDEARRLTDGLRADRGRIRQTQAQLRDLAARMAAVRPRVASARAAAERAAAAYAAARAPVQGGGGLGEMEALRASLLRRIRLLGDGFPTLSFTDLEGQVHALSREVETHGKRAEDLAGEAAKGEAKARDALAEMAQAEAILGGGCTSGAKPPDADIADLEKGVQAMDAQVFGAQGARLQDRAEACRRHAAARAGQGPAPSPPPVPVSLGPAPPAGGPGVPVAPPPPMPPPPDLRAPLDGEPPPLEVGIRGGPGRVSVGGTVHLAAVVRGGRPPYRYRWQAEHARGESNDPSIRYTPRTKGERHVSITVMDSEGRSAATAYTVEAFDASDPPGKPSRPVVSPPPRLPPAPPPPRIQVAAVRVYTGTLTWSGTASAGGKTAACPRGSVPLTIRVHPDGRAEAVRGGGFFARFNDRRGAVTGITCTASSRTVSYQGTAGSGSIRVGTGSRTVMEGRLRDGVAAGTLAFSGTSRPEEGNQNVLIHWTIRGEWRAETRDMGVAGGRR